ncbi:transcriptional regulator [Duganella sp. FT80W]|uniref:Transcriptional regulator n=1 Tax=Duganella guangzhouensis TaxID=2666084 RepID=A0A6I2KZ01_9BURK|nr:transcriptional regulator [Duganella guangzhouensis]MRW89456.1 transcriptional regulator [Duganella guangzhouensis]
MKPIVIGVMSPERIRERIAAIVRGAVKLEPNEPKIWFASMQSLAEVLSDDNRALLRIISESQPCSISALAETTGQEPAELARILRGMSKYGIVELKRERNRIRPVVKAVEFHIVAP